MYLCEYCFQFTSLGETTCYIGIVPNDCSTWTLGIPFISKYYTTFRYNNDEAAVAFTDKVGSE